RLLRRTCDYFASIMALAARSEKRPSSQVQHWRWPPVAHVRWTIQRCHPVGTRHHSWDRRTLLFWYGLPTHASPRTRTSPNGHARGTRHETPLTGQETCGLRLRRGQETRAEQQPDQARPTQ